MGLMIHSFAPSVTICGDKGLVFSWLWFYTTLGDFAKIGSFWNGLEYIYLDNKFRNSFTFLNDIYCVCEGITLART